MYYFAYASNMNKKLMAERCPEARAIAVATLPNYKLIFTGFSRAQQGKRPAIMEFTGLLNIVE